MGRNFWLVKPFGVGVTIVEVMESLTLRVVPMPMPDEVDQSFEVELHYFRTKASELKKLPKTTTRSLIHATRTRALETVAGSIKHELFLG
jgi:hypothetical protein